MAREGYINVMKLSAYFCKINFRPIQPIGPNDLYSSYLTNYQIALTVDQHWHNHQFNYSKSKKLKIFGWH